MASEDRGPPSGLHDEDSGGEGWEATSHLK
jgi:hypothetical protein